MALGGDDPYFMLVQFYEMPFDYGLKRVYNKISIEQNSQYKNKGISQFFSAEI